MFNATATQFSWCWIWIFSLQCQNLSFKDSSVSYETRCYILNTWWHVLCPEPVDLQKCVSCFHCICGLSSICTACPGNFAVFGGIWAGSLSLHLRIRPSGSFFLCIISKGGPSLWRVLPDGVCLAEHWFAPCAEPSAFPSSSPLCLMHLDNNTLTSRRVLFTRQCFFIYPEIICWALHVAEMTIELFMFPKAALRLWNS